MQQFRTGSEVKNHIQLNFQGKSGRPNVVFQLDFCQHIGLNGSPLVTSAVRSVRDA